MRSTPLHRPATRALPRSLRRRVFGALLLILLAGAFACQNPPSGDVDWPQYLGDPHSSQFSPLKSLTPENVQGLEVAWTYHSGGADTVHHRTQIQCNPLVVNGVLYGTSPRLEVFALDAATGEELWKFAPLAGGMQNVNRGLAWWQDGTDRRLLAALGQHLYALDMDTGLPIPSFGENGRVDLHLGLGEEHALKFVTANTPGVVFEDLYILGSRVDETWGAAPGHIRAFDVRSGALRWIFHTIPRPGETGYDSWEDPEAWKKVGGANAWAGLALDPEAGIVFVPTGSASYDFWGGNRKGSNLFANCLLALDARTGRRIWHFQTVHHDLWDRDLPAPPNLLTVTHGGRRIEAVAQVTKTGFVFLFERRTGKPLFPIEERPVPPSRLPGEAAWPTQPVPTRPEPFARQSLRDADSNPYSPDSTWIRDSLRRIRKSSMWLPPDREPTLIFPGFDGGAEWGGAAHDPDGILYVNANNMAWVQRMLPTLLESPVHPGKQLYHLYCSNCHGWDLRGDPTGTYPALLDLKARKTPPEVQELLLRGSNRMPSYRQLSPAEREAVIAFLFERPAPAHPELERLRQPEVPFRADGYNRFLDSRRMPAISPPWGTLSAIDLNTGTYRWQVPLGEWPELTAQGLPPTGSENYGGPVVTAAGVLFIAATRDAKIRAFDAETGRELWQAPLPAGGYATPAVYAVGGKPFVVIACGGGKMGTPSGDAYVAFSFPE